MPQKENPILCTGPSRARRKYATETHRTRFYQRTVNSYFCNVNACWMFLLVPFPRVANAGRKCNALILFFPLFFFFFLFYLVYLWFILKEIPIAALHRNLAYLFVPPMLFTAWGEKTPPQPTNVNGSWYKMKVAITWSQITATHVHTCIFILT